jgi:uncharacterized membrane protein YfcA
VLALLLGSIVGISLGLTGGGGSIFAVPLLIYGLGFGFQQATAISLAVVGLTALYGAVLHRGQGQVVWLAGVLLGVGGIAGVPIGRFLAKQLSERTSLLLFACLMVYIASRMLFPRWGPASPKWLRCNAESAASGWLRPACVGRLGAAGFITGILSGLFGIGGGFLLTPTLLVVAQATIAQAMATSLVSIVIIASAGLWSSTHLLVDIGLGVPALFLAGSGLGMTSGVAIKKKCAPRVLQVIFGISVLATALFVLVFNL